MSADDRVEARTVADVKTSTKFIIDSYKAKMESLRKSGDQVSRILRFGLDAQTASQAARKFFGSEKVRYVAVDGTNSMDQELDLLVFYVGSFAYSGTLDFVDGVRAGEPVPEKEGVSVSAAIPLSEEDATSVYGRKSESGMEVDTERLPSSLMHLSEYFLVHKALEADPEIRVCLFDRTLAGDVSHLVWSTKDIISGHGSVLEGMETSAGKVTNFDLELARILITNADLGVPAPRSHLLKYAAVQALFSGESLTVSQILSKVGGVQGRAPRLEDDLGDLQKKYRIFSEHEGSYRLNPGVANYWDRVLEATMRVSGHVFHPEGGHPLLVTKAGRLHWVTADDLDFMVLVMIQAILRTSWQRNILPIGFVKDSSAYELVKAAVPILTATGKLDRWADLPNFNSDKMLLQTNSVVNCAHVPTPWHTFDFDACFRTMAPESGSATLDSGAYVAGAYANVISTERVFVKDYIQLWSSSSSPEVRSHVFAIDRPAFPGYDHWDELVLRNKDGTVEEEVRPILHFERASDMTALVMAILCEMGTEVVPEALGHNFPLFLADKKAKSVLEQTKAAYLAAVAVEMAKSNLDQQVLFSQRFRDYRSKMEGKRRA